MFSNMWILLNQSKMPGPRELNKLSKKKKDFTRLLDENSNATNIWQSYDEYDDSTFIYSSKIQQSILIHKHDRFFKDVFT